MVKEVVPYPINLFAASPQKRAFADKLRSTMTPVERRLWSRLQHIRRGPKARPIPAWRPQVVIRGWIVDFYNDEKLLAVEIDGSTHDLEYDALRDSVLQHYGIRTIRFTNSDIYTRLDSVIHELECLSIR